MLNLFMFLFLVTYLSPLLFMAIASLTPHRQFLDSNALILPSKRITFYYDGKDRIVYQVPTAQGIHRYILGAPAVFITLAGWGNKPVFDRAWTMLSILLMGLLAMLFAFNMWVA